MALGARDDTPRWLGQSGFGAMGALLREQLHAEGPQEGAVGLWLDPERIVGKALIQRQIQELCGGLIESRVGKDGNIRAGQ